MSNETNRTSGTELQRMFDGGQNRFDPERMFQTSMTKRVRFRTCVDGYDTAREIAILVGGVGGVGGTADAYQRAIQALRDVRHLLPPEGVAIVDAVLDCAG